MLTKVFFPVDYHLPQNGFLLNVNWQKSSPIVRQPKSHITDTRGGNYLEKCKSEKMIWLVRASNLNPSLYHSPGEPGKMSCRPMGFKWRTSCTFRLHISLDSDGRTQVGKAWWNSLGCCGDLFVVSPNPCFLFSWEISISPSACCFP